LRVIITIKNDKGTCYDLEVPNTINAELFIEKIIEVVGVVDKSFVNNIKQRRLAVEESNIEICGNTNLASYGVVDGSTLIVL
jgi:uncharacterized ubiquitin-like protein YukD